MGRKAQDHYKYNRLISALREKIFAGEFAPGGRLPPERKLVEMFGFARITIRTALKELKEDGLIEQRPGAGTFVKSSKKRKAEADKKEYRFCFLCNPSPMNLSPEADPYNGQLLLGFYKARNLENMFSLDTVVIPKSGCSIHQYAEQNRIDFAQWDGLILSCSPTDADIDYLLSRNLNFVVLGEMESMRYFPVVTVDNFKGAYDLTNHLLQQGKKAPLLLFVQDGPLWNRRLVAGFRQALADAGLPGGAERVIDTCPRTMEEARAYMLELIREELSFDSLVILGDIQSIGVLEALKLSGTRVPEDVAVAIYDGYRWVANMFPHIPYLVQPFAKIGEITIEMLKDRLNSKDHGISVRVIPPELAANDLGAMGKHAIK